MCRLQHEGPMEQNQGALTPEDEEEAQCKGKGRTTAVVTSQLLPCGPHVVKDPLFLGKLSKERMLLLAAKSRSGSCWDAAGASTAFSFLGRMQAKPGQSKCSRQSSLQDTVTLFPSGTAGPAASLPLASDCHHPTPSSSLPFLWSSQGGGSPFWSGLLRKTTGDYPLSAGFTSSHDPNHCLSHYSQVTLCPNS